MKVCTKCSVEKPLDEFYKDKRNKIDGKGGKCKQCNKQAAHEHYLQNKDRYNAKMNKWHNDNKHKVRQCQNNIRLNKKTSYWIVYQLPNANNYVGQTNDPYYRMYHHNANGRNTDKWIELHRCNTKAEALKLEAHYHSLGYPGENTYYNRNKTHLETLKTTI